MVDPDQALVQPRYKVLMTRAMLMGFGDIRGNLKGWRMDSEVLRVMCRRIPEKRVPASWARVEVSMH